MVKLDGVVYRCISLQRWKKGQIVPRRAVYDEGRWNPAPQWALYTSHTAEVAIEEKRCDRARRRRGLVESIGKAIPDPLADEFVVIEFPVPAEGRLRTLDARRLPPGLLDPCLRPDNFAESHRVAREAIDAGMVRLIVPSCPCPDDWNSVFYYFGDGQLEEDDLPSPDPPTREVGRIALPLSS